MSTKVTFIVPAEVVGDAKDGVLLGEFNNWDPARGISLRKKKDGSLTTEVELEAGQSYQYRYFLSDGRWVNDRNESSWSNAYGQQVENNIVSVPVANEANIVAKQPAVKKAAPAKEAVKKDVVKKTAEAKPAAKKAAPKKVAKKTTGDNTAPAGKK